MPEAELSPGTLVRLGADPSRIGVVTKLKREVAGKTYYQVQFPDRANFYLASSLEVVRGEPEDPLELLGQGRVGRARDLRGALTHIRLTGRLADLIYSMETTNTDFYAYQFKPVLNFLDSPSSGILIADEVGLGKTIEAGLIWTELRARFDCQRLLVVCPAMLREKWQLELQKRFGVDASILGAADLSRLLDRVHRGEQRSFAAICSMQGIRPTRDWAKEQVTTSSAKLARLLDDYAFEEPLIDLLVVDEAHYLRNPETMTAKLGRLLRPVAESLVLLSATPVHLKSQDLFGLLNLVDEDTFSSPTIFDDIVMANAPLISLRDEILAGRTTPESFSAALHTAKQSYLLRDNQQIMALEKQVPTSSDLSQPALRATLAERVERLNLLSSAVSRTRKRDVHERKVIRQAIAEHVPMSPEEAAAYTAVTEIVSEYARRVGGHEGFLLVQPQRQLSSSMAGALGYWSDRAASLVTDFEDGDDDIEQPIRAAPGPLVAEIIARARTIGRAGDLRRADNKYARLLEMFRHHFAQGPTEKVILFASFKATLRYLSKRLSADGIPNVLLTGDSGAQKTAIIDAFGQRSDGAVLLASEVASEGVDLQFSRVLVNYDLPWNPMRVEQRIGRIDRIGQRSERITIWNLFYAGTIDERIHDRLYMRLGIFERTLGGLEQILGDEIRKLTVDLLSGQLTPEQELRRIDQTALALETCRQQEARLEEEAGNLLAHGDYIVRQVNAARQMSRWITAADLWNYVRDFIERKYVGSDMRQVDSEELVFEFRLSESARVDFADFIRRKRLEGQTRLVSDGHRGVRVRFSSKPNVKGGRTEESVTQFHPLVRFISEQLSNESGTFFPVQVVELSRTIVPRLEKGRYVFVVDLWSLKGVRVIEKLYFKAARLAVGGQYGELSEDDSEMLVTTASMKGIDRVDAGEGIDFGTARDVAERLVTEALVQYEAFAARVSAENLDRARLQRASVERHHERQKSTLERILRKHESLERAALAAATKGRINKLDAKFSLRLAEIKKAEQTREDRQEVAIGVVDIV